MVIIELAENVFEYSILSLMEISGVAKWDMGASCMSPSIVSQIFNFCDSALDPVERLFPDPLFCLFYLSKFMATGTSYTTKWVLARSQNSVTLFALGVSIALCAMQK